MSTKPIDRLLFVQGNCCFFCRQPLSKDQASVEHLVASSNGGSNAADNCVACCKTVNHYLGNMSVKEKFQVILNHQGQFRCPNGVGSAKPAAAPASRPQVATPPKVAAPKKPAAPPTPAAPPKGPAQPRAVAPPKPTAPPAAAAASLPAPTVPEYDRVVAFLKGHAKTRPRTRKTLTNAIAALVKGTPPSQAADMVQQLVEQGLVKVDGTKVIYTL